MSKLNGYLLRSSYLNDGTRLAGIDYKPCSLHSILGDGQNAFCNYVISLLYYKQIFCSLASAVFHVLYLDSFMSFNHKQLQYKHIIVLLVFYWKYFDFKNYPY